MIIHAEESQRERTSCHDAISSSLMALASFLRGIPLFFANRPKTPLRVLCVMAFDTLHRLHHSQGLPRTKLKLLSALLDFGASANAAFDNKPFCRDEFRMTQQFLQNAGVGLAADEFLKRLRALEKQRPGIGGDLGHFRRVRLYREAIVRLSLAMVAVVASGRYCLDEEIQATYADKNLEILFRIVMQCQVIDDVLDYSQDMSAELPSFLTASESLPLAFELTRLAAEDYAGDRNPPRTDTIIPLRLALFGVSRCAKLVVTIGRWVQRAHVQVVNEVGCLPGRAMCDPHSVYLD
jgi:hypothetical protein